MTCTETHYPPIAKAKSFEPEPFSSQQDHKYCLGLFTPPSNLDEIYWLEASSLVADRTQALRRAIDFAGAGYNMAITLGPLSPRNSVAALFPVSVDRCADDLVNTLRECGIDTNTIARVPGNIRKNLVLEFGGGHRRIVKDPKPTTSDMSAYPWTVLGDCGMLAINGGLLTDVLVQCINEVNRLGIPFCWNPATSHFDLLWNGAAAGATLLQMNAEEATAWLGVGPNFPARYLPRAVQTATGAANTVITCGPEGAWGADCDGRTCYGRPAKRQVAQAVGLGDRFFALSCLAFIKQVERLDLVLEMAGEQLRALLK